VDVRVCPRVRQVYLAGLGADIGKGVEHMRQLLDGEVLRTVLAGVDGPVDKVGYRTVTLRAVSTTHVAVLFLLRRWRWRWCDERRRGISVWSGAEKCAKEKGSKGGGEDGEVLSCYKRHVEWMDGMGTRVFYTDLWEMGVRFWLEGRREPMIKTGMLGFPPLVVKEGGAEHELFHLANLDAVQFVLGMPDLSFLSQKLCFFKSKSNQDTIYSAFQLRVAAQFETVQVQWCGSDGEVGGLGGRSCAGMTYGAARQDVKAVAPPVFRCQRWKWVEEGAKVLSPNASAGAKIAVHLTDGRGYSGPENLPNGKIERLPWKDRPYRPVKVPLVPAPKWGPSPATFNASHRTEKWKVVIAGRTEVTG